MTHRNTRIGLTVSILFFAVLFTNRIALAACSDFTVFPTSDTGLVFNVAAGLTQTQSLLLENTSDSTVTFVGLATNMFGLNWTQVTVKPYDTASIFITFKPPAGTPGGTTDGLITIYKYYIPNCKWTLNVHGTVPGGTGNQKNVTISPASFSLSTVQGADTCMRGYLQNPTGGKVTVTNYYLSQTSSQFSISPVFKNSFTIDSAGSFQFQVCFKGGNVSAITDTFVAICQYGGTTHRITALLTGHTTTTTPSALTADPAVLNFGSVLFGTKSCQNITIKNNSANPILILDWYSPDTGVYAITPAYTSYKDSVTLYAGMTKTFSVCYTPQSPGVYSDFTFAVDYQILTPPFNVLALPVVIHGNSVDSGITGACLITSQGANSVDAIVPGTSATHILQLSNTTAHDMIVTGDSISGTDAAVFQSASTFPLTVPAHSSNAVYTYTFTPQSALKNEFDAQVIFTVSDSMSTCHSVTGNLIGYTVHSGSSTDTIVRPIFSGTRTLAIEGSDNKPATDTFRFKNDLQVDVTVKTISVDSTQYFSVSYNPSPTPFVLHTGDILSVIVTFIATDHAVHHATLYIEASHNLQSPTFQLEGLTLAASRVATALPHEVAVKITPNPAQNYVNIDLNGVRMADCEIDDVLGQTIASSKTNSHWKWDATAIATGSYIIRISGVSGEGIPFVTSQRLIITK